jgi:hypothetical protein
VLRFVERRKRGGRKKEEEERRKRSKRGRGVREDTFSKIRMKLPKNQISLFFNVDFAQWCHCF